MSRTNHRPFRFRTRRGTTLAEVLIALFIAAMAVTVFGTAMPFAAEWVSRSRLTDVATNACEPQIEYWRDIGYGSLPSIPSGNSSTSQAFTPPSALSGATGTVTFTRLTDSLTASTSDTGVVKVDATVVWTGTGHDGGTVTLTTLIGK